MTNDIEDDVRVEFAIEQPSRFGASSSGLQTLSDKQLTGIEQSITNLMASFVPPATTVESDKENGMKFTSFEMQASFKVFAESDGVIRLLISKTGGEAAIQCKATWSCD